MHEEGCDPASPQTRAPNAHVIHRDVLVRRTTLTAAACCSGAALLLFSLQALAILPLGRIGTALWCSWLLALASAAARISYQKVPAEQLADDWADRYNLGPGLPLGDPALDPLFTQNTRRCVFSRPGTWTVSGMIGGVCWGGAVAVTVQAATGYTHPTPVNLLLGLVFLFCAAVHLTCYAVTAHSIYGQRAIRRAGALAHWRLRAAQGHTPERAAHDGNGSLHLVTPRETGSHRAAQ